MEAGKLSVQFKSSNIAVTCKGRAVTSINLNVQRACSSSGVDIYSNKNCCIFFANNLDTASYPGSRKRFYASS